MTKAFPLWLWQNSPSVNTPLGESMLNKVNVGLSTVDDRVIILDTTKANQSDLLTALEGVSFDGETGILTFYKKNGATIVIDTGLSKLAVNLDFDDDTQQFILYLADGTEKRIDASAFITQTEFVESGTVYWTVSNDGKVQADIKKGSITADMLEPDYLANVQLYASQALSSATVSESYAVGGTGTRDGEDTDNAKYYSQVAGNLVDEAKKTLEEVGKKVTETTFHVNLETGKLEYDSPNYNFTVNNSTGKLEWEVAL